MLPEVMWLEWIADEIMCEGSGGEVDVLNLFQKCFADYNYLKVRKKYIKYAL
jgi:hypothetical protein